jgi:hypothetical protein
MADAKSLRTRLEQFLGEAQYHKFVECGVYKGRLAFWQEQAWEKFVAAHPEFAVSVDELASALRVCHLHRDELLAGLGGPFRGSRDDAPAYWDALSLFPNARSGLVSIAGTLNDLEVFYCPTCRRVEIEWLAASPPPDRAPKLTIAIDWADLEKTLHSLCLHEIGKFAQSHRTETFYGFALDCHSDYGQVLLCLNTPEALCQMAIAYSNGSPPRKAAEVYERELRWSLGDWKYQGFNSETFEKSWDPFQELVSNAYDEEEPADRTPTQERFMQSACRVLLRLESSNAFNSLQRTDDFQTLAMDHDESDSAAWERLEAVRVEMAGASRSD